MCWPARAAVQVGQGAGPQASPGHEEVLGAAPEASVARAELTAGADAQPRPAGATEGTIVVSEVRARQTR